MNRVSDYVECTLCARRSIFLQVNLDTGECERCTPVLAGHVPTAVTA